VTNWPDYNRALVARGGVTLWLHEEVLRDWRAVGGKGMRYSDAAILCALSIRAVYKLPLRQTQGFLLSLKTALGLTIPVPHYATLSRRAADLAVPELKRGAQKGPLHLAIDSTGLKVFGEGEWKMRQHGKGKRRVWRKLHLAVDTETGEILAHILTGSDHHDGPELPGLLAKIKETVTVVSADKGYDSFSCHRAILAIGAKPVIPPKTGAAITPPPKEKDAPNTRGDAVRRITEIGAEAWKVETGYHRRSLAETAMARYKTIIGPNLRSRNRDTQITEAAVAIRCLNTLTALGMPKTAKIA
jgi:hypothetical protein